MGFGEVQGWATVYITGKRGFGEVVVEKLDNHWVSGTTGLTDGALMFWLPDVSKLRKFKVAIGARLIFKYRLRFFLDVDEQLQSDIIPDHEFSVSEKVMITEMITWEKMHMKTRALAI